MVFINVFIFWLKGKFLFNFGLNGVCKLILIIIIGMVNFLINWVYFCKEGIKFLWNVFVSGIIYILYVLLICLVFFGLIW